MTKPIDNTEHAKNYAEMINKLRVTGEYMAITQMLIHQIILALVEAFITRKKDVNAELERILSSIMQENKQDSNGSKYEPFSPSYTARLQFIKKKMAKTKKDREEFKR